MFILIFSKELMFGVVSMDVNYKFMKNKSCLIPDLPIFMKM